MKNNYGFSSDKALNDQLRCTLSNCACRCTNFIWVSDKIKIVYFETPKCGCSSIKMAFDIGLQFTPLHFAMAHMIASQRYCSGRSKVFLTETNTPFCHGAGMTLREFYEASVLAATELRKGVLLSDPVGRFEFRHFFGSHRQAVDLFQNYRKFVVLRNPFDRLRSAWNMFYNSSNYRLMERVTHCPDSAQEAQSFRFFFKKLARNPNHHFESLSLFVPADLLFLGKVDGVMLESLDTFWKGLPIASPLVRKNHASSYLQIDMDENVLSKEKAFLSHYSDDFRMINFIK